MSALVLAFERAAATRNTQRDELLRLFDAMTPDAREQFLEDAELFVELPRDDRRRVRKIARRLAPPQEGKLLRDSRAMTADARGTLLDLEDVFTRPMAAQPRNIGKPVITIDCDEREGA